LSVHCKPPAHCASALAHVPWALLDDALRKSRHSEKFGFRLDAATIAGQTEMESYYLDKIKVMEEALTRLNILEHAGEIFFICREIVHAKKLLKQLCLKKKK
jgi:hypothetical protein